MRRRSVGRDDAEAERVEHLETLCSHLQLIASRAEIGGNVFVPERSIEVCAACLPLAGAIDGVVRRSLTGLIADVIRYNRSHTVQDATTLYVRARCLRAVFRSAVKDPAFAGPFLEARQVKGVPGWRNVKLGWVDSLMPADEQAKLIAARGTANSD